MDTIEVSDAIRAESESLFANYGQRLLDRLNTAVLKALEI